MGRRRISGKPGDAQTGNGGGERVAAEPEELVSLAGMTFGAVIVRWSPESRDVRGVDAVSGRPYAASDPALLLWVHAAGLARGRQRSDIPAVTREMLNLFAAARGA
jgi:hypothetical protein